MRIDGMNGVTSMIDLNTDKAGSVRFTPQNVPGVHKNGQEDNNGLDISEKTLIKAIEKANEKLVVANRELEFSIHEKTKEIIVRVIDVDTKEVIREIPPEKILNMVANMLELAGLLVDERR